MAADNLAVGFRGQTHKEKGKVGGDGLSLSSPNEKRLQTMKRYELNAMLKF